MRAREVLTPWRIRSRARMRAMLRSYTPRPKKPSTTALLPHWVKLRGRRGASALAARGVCEVRRAAAVGEASGCGYPGERERASLRAARALATKYGEAN